jgi:hypothetical protein
MIKNNIERNNFLMSGITLLSETNQPFFRGQYRYKHYDKKSKNDELEKKAYKFYQNLMVSRS